MVTWPRNTVARPLMRSQERALVLCGMADDPTCPSTESFGDELLPGHESDRHRQVGRSAADPEQARDDVEVQRSRIHLPHCTKCAGRTRAGLRRPLPVPPPSRGHCRTAPAGPPACRRDPSARATGSPPQAPRGGGIASINSSPAAAKRRPNDVTCAGTLCVRATTGIAANSPARCATAAAAATALVRTRCIASRICCLLDVLGGRRAR